MLRLLVWGLIFSHTAQAVTLNRTLLNQCASNFSNCTISNTLNCTQTFNSCLNNVEIRSKRPQSCYQADAAEYALRVATWVSISIFASTLIATNTMILIRFLSNRFHCCRICQDTPPQSPEEPTAQVAVPNHITLLKAVTGNTMTTLSTVITGTFTFVSSGWIFSLWQAWTNKNADCEFFLDQQ